MASQSESFSSSQSTIKSLKKEWLKSVTAPSSSSTSTSIEVSLINRTLSPISQSDPIWTCNAILDFLSDNQDSQNLTVSINSLGSLIDLGLHVTQSSSNQNGWEHLKHNDSETELLSIRYHLVAYQRLLLVWEKLYPSQSHIQTQHHPEADRMDATPQSQPQDDDPWDQVEDEYSNQISTQKPAPSSSTLNQVQPSSSSTTLFPFSSIQPFLNSTPLQSFLSILMGNANSDSSIESPSEIIDEMVGFLENLHLKLKGELFENRFKLIDLIIRILCLDSDREDGNQDWILQRLIDVRLLPTLDEQGVETSIWNLESTLRQLSHQESVDDPRLIKKLIDLELIESKEDRDVGLETIVGTPSSPSLLLEFYREEINSLQLDYGHDSLNLCLHLSNWISTFIYNSISNKDPEDWNKRLGKELLALNLLNDNDSSSRNLENFREAIRSRNGRIEILKDYLIQKNLKSRIGRDSDWDQFFNLLESISELGQDQRNQDKILDGEISVNPSYDSIINFSSSIPTSTELFLRLILELVSSSPTTLTPTLSFTIITQLLKVNHRNKRVQSSSDLEINFILSLLLGHDGGKDTETLENFKTLNQVLIDVQNNRTSKSQDESLQTLINFLKPYKSSKSNPNSLVIDLLNDPTSPLSISNLDSKESASQSISRRIPKLLKCFKMLLKWQKVNPSSKVEIPKSLNEILLISLDLKEQNRLVKSICSKDSIIHINQSSRGENWFDLLIDLMTLRNEEFGLLRLMGGKEIVKIWFGGILSTGDFEMSKQLHQQLLRKIPSEFTLDDEELEALVLKSSREFYDSSDSLNLHRGSMKLAYDCLSIIPSSSIIKKEKAFIEATSKLSTFQLPSSTSSPFGPSKLTSKEIRSTSDRLTFISLLLSSKPEIYKSSEMILDLGWKLSNTPVSKDQPEDEEVEEVSVSKPLIEIKCLAMLIDSSIANEDLLEGYNLSQRLVEKISEMRKRAQSMIKNQDKENIDVKHSAKGRNSKKMIPSSAIDLLPIVEEIGWKSCYQLCKHPAWGEEEEEVEDGESEEIKDGQEINQISEKESINPNRSSRGKASKDPDVSKRLKLMSQVISLCPKNQLGTFLERWRTLDKEHFQISLQQDYLSKNNLGNSYSSRLNSKFLTESLGKASDLSFISPFSSLFNSSGLSSQLSSLGGSGSGIGGGGGAKVATKPKANAPSGGFGKAAQLFDGFGDSSNRNSSGTSTTTSSSPWDYANVAIDPAERAARAARNFFGGFGNSPVLGSAGWTGSNSDSPREGSGDGNGENGRERSRDGNGSRNVSGASGFSFTRGMGWLMGEEER